MTWRRTVAALTGLAALLTLAAQPSSAAPAPTITDGTWTIGRDVPAGIYVVTEQLHAPCRLTLLTREGPRADETPAQWRPEVSLRDGDRFATAGCGTWARIG